MQRITLLLSVVAISHVYSASTFADLVYWTSRFNQSLSVGDTDTLNVTTILSSPSIDPWGIAVDTGSSDIYFTDGFDAGDPNPVVRTVGTNGSGLATLTTSTSGMRQIELDLAGGKMYWAAEGGFGTGDGDAIYRANLDGTNKEVIVSGLYNPRAMAIDLLAGKIYFDNFVLATSTRSILQANLDGSGLQSILTGQGAIWGMDLDLLNQKLYWGTSDTRVVNRANVNGTGLETILSGLSFDVLDIKVDPLAGQFYAAGDNFGGIPGGAIVRANLDGSNLTTLFTGVNATNIFVAESNAAVPEPSAILLAGLGGLLMAFRRR